MQPVAWVIYLGWFDPLLDRPMADHIERGKCLAMVSRLGARPLHFRDIFPLFIRYAEIY